jgi:hypothetical protein
VNWITNIQYYRDAQNNVKWITNIKYCTGVHKIM